MAFTRAIAVPMFLTTIDFEASCLPRHGRSFPIEVGISADGFTARAWLIRPHDDWAGWTWSDEAEALHGITRAQLDREGLPAAVVLAELTAAVGGGAVLADSVLDAYWLETLAAAAGRSSPFRIDHVRGIIDALGAGPEAIIRAKAVADATTLTRHRAGEDARWLARFVTALEATVPAAGWAQAA